MNSGQNEAAAAAKKEKVFETQQRTQESGSENEETDSITDQSSQSKSTKSATQFSVQRSDTDGLRMKISAIRNPPTSLITLNKKTAANSREVVAELASNSSRKKLTKVRKMSDAPQHEGSGCSTEASNRNKHTTRDNDTALLSTNIVNTTKKMKVKRKKISTKSGSSNLNNNNNISNNNNNNNKSKRPSAAAFSSDSDDDLPLKMHMQRAPRLLLTAIGGVGMQSQADNIGISSSDNEYLPNLVKAAIKCVESDTEDTNSVAAAAAAKSKQQLPQYQSTLLQDFMEKTQMLNHTGSNAATLTNPTTQPGQAATSERSYVQQQQQQQPQQQQRKRRGRPKKLQTTVAAAVVAAAVAVAVPTINESADSGVISTTPSPKMQQVALSDNPKPKIDIAYLDKRMYATERVLYPPPRSKRRQSNKKTNKEELQLDPLWRKIDVNKKFRLRTVSGYKSDGGGGGGSGGLGSGTSNTICSKILAAKSGYVSDYGSVRHQRHNHNSGYKSDASCKSRYSSRSCASRRMSRAKSCGYRSDCKESSGKSSKSLRRRRRASMLKSSHEPASNALSDDHDQDILQLAGLSLGQSSEESNEYISKPSLKCLPSTSASKKYGEINRFVTTGQYFSGTTKAITGGVAGGAAATASAENFMQSKMMLQRKNSISGDTIVPSRSACKIKSRRSSAASMCSSYVSSASRMRRRHRRKSFSHAKSLNIDSKLLTEIDIIASTFHARCRIQDDRLTASSGKEKLLAEANKLQATLTAPIATALPLLNGSSNSAIGSNGTPNAAGATKPVKRALKKRKLNEPLIDFAMLSASAGNSNNLSNNTSNNNGAKRRHKKSSGNSGGSNSSSPDDHKLPLKKRHYLVTTGADVSTAFASNGKLNAEAWAAAAAAAKNSASTKAQAQFNAKKLTPKKRHLLVSQEAALPTAAAAASASPLRIVVDNNSISGGKLLDISPSSLCSLKQQRRQGGKSKSSAAAAAAGVAARELSQQLQSPAGSNSCPPPGIFEPSVELEIQIPIAKLNEAVITKSEVESPLLGALDIKEDANKKEQCQRVLETLLHKTGGNLLLKRKRKKINRTGFPTVRRKKRKVSIEQAALQQDQQSAEPLQSARETRSSSNQTPAVAMDCERVPQAGEARETFVARSSNQRTPRLSVVALERLQRPQTPANITGNGRGRPRGRGRPKMQRAQPTQATIEEEQPQQQEQLQPQQQQEPQQEQQQHSLVLELRPAKKRGRASKQSDAAASPKLKRKLETSIKLPAGIDPNTNFSCKIRLKRRKNMQQEEPIVKPVHPQPSQQLPEPPMPQSNDEQAQIELEAAAKRREQPVPANEHHVLPVQESSAHQSLDYASCSDTSEDKCSTTSQRKRSKLKKNYLPAGLFSNHYKELPVATGTATTATPVPVKQTSKKLPGEQQLLGSSLLPPPSYCERYFRRAISDFELPYDIWWAYSHDKLPTRHVVPSWNYRKIRTNVYAESVRPNLAGFDHPNCNCKPQSSGSCLDNCLNRMVYTECAPSNCPAGDKCRNQKIQRHEVAPGVERFMTTDKGWGVRTKLPIVKGTYILEYVGEVVTEREFKQRMASIYLNDTHHYCLHLDGGLVIDGQRMGSDCRFVNHSCEPNCEMQKWSVNGLSRMVLFAKRAIEQGEELTYDYNFSLFNPSEGQPCRCNMPQCRGVIGGKSQRIKPLPVEAKAGAGGDGVTPGARDATSNQNGRQRKHKAKKHAQRQQQAAKEAEVVARVQQLSEKEKKLVKQCSIFLVRNFEKIRRCKAKKAAAKAQRASPTAAGDADAPGRRPSTPSSTSLLAAQISALCTPRNMKTRGLTQAVQDPELEKMAKMAVVLRDICTALESVKMFELLTTVTSNKKKKQLKASRLDFKAIQAQVEQGHYKTPLEFDEQMQQLFVEVRQLHGEDEIKTKALETLMASYEQQKSNNYAHLLEILGKPELLHSFKSQLEQLPIVEQSQQSNEQLHKSDNAVGVAVPQFDTSQLPIVAGDEEDVIRCICGLYKDEGLMIQCAKCMVWQHTECTKADIDADNYQCERCEPREVDREIPLDDYTEEGHRYYLSLMRGDLQVRQGDAVYVLRDIPIKDEAGKVLPSQKHTYETIGAIDYQECDIFRVEHLWKNEEGKRFIFGHHFLRPHETFHEPSRRFYPNEVVRVSLYEVVPIELVIGRCWVLDRTTFCKGRPMECNDEDHCFICELRVDKTARFFSKAKANHPACTKSYAFRKFPEKLKISKSYAPHDVDPSLLKTKKQKTDIDVATTRIKVGRQEPRAGPASTGSRKQRNAQAGTAGAVTETAVQVLTPTAPNGQVLKKKRSRLENVLNTMKLKCLDAQTAQEQPIDLSYLLSGRGARQRKTNCTSSNSSNNNNSSTPCA
ncbi:histone-lysine N-methyltransferase ash1 [Drosophila albomicans]|uniref:Histone-lysine N-methyltransferase ash1 n=1 Tax=Drosophila albomicans TaxID=7291 RepID=A0A6P8Z1X6_DROAB|nr:histone-lysine N-methyltransferase ash1 [Drosophila albomicans]